MLHMVQIRVMIGNNNKGFESQRDPVVRQRELPPPLCLKY